MGRVVLALAFLSLLLRPAPAAAQTVLPGDESQAFALVNATRANHALSPLTRSSTLDEIARQQSRRMVDAEGIFHNPDLAGALNAAGLDWIFTGENVGVGPGVVEIHDAFVASLHHYENIVKSDFDHVGVGVLSRPEGGVYVTHVFAQLSARLAPTLEPVGASPTPPRSPSPTLVPVATPAPTPPSAPVAVEGGVIIPGPDFGETPEPPRSRSFPATLLEWIFGR
jgi:hypothetical protein